MTFQRRGAVFFGVLGFLILAASQATAQINIVIRAGAGLSSNQAALDSFNRAANQWAARITDPITILVDADLSSTLDSNTIGETNAVYGVAAYDVVRDAMVADSEDEADDSIVSFLPTAQNFRAALPGNASLTGRLLVTKANFKALGFDFTGSPFPDRDGTITFNSNFDFDYDNRNGSEAGTTDFETVAAHEIGHLLGFTSAVDNVDFGQTSIDPTTLDLFRFANGAVPSSATEFSTAERSLLAGSEAVTSDVVSQYRMSTGFNQGDGRQASHWKANELTGNGTPIGIMDPTLAEREVITVSTADLRAMDLIGYDIVTSVETPEPTSLGLALPLLGLACISLRKRAKRRRTCTE